MKRFFDLFKEMDHSIVNYPKGSMVFVENEVCTSFSLILTGAIEIKKISSDGNLLIVASFKSGDSIGESLLFGSSNIFPMSGFAKEDTSILYVSKATILSMCQDDLEFLSKFLQFLSDKSFTLSQKLNQISLKTIRQKICEFLLREHHRQGSLDIKLDMNKTELANQMGVLRPSLYRELNRLRDEAILSYNKDYIFIKSLKGIRSGISE